MIRIDAKQLHVKDAIGNPWLDDIYCCKVALSSQRRSVEELLRFVSIVNVTALANDLQDFGMPVSVTPQRKGPKKPSSRSKFRRDCPTSSLGPYRT